MFEIGNQVAFFGLEDNFDHLNLNVIENFIEDCSWYEVIGVNVPNDDFITVRSRSQGKDIPVVKSEYQIHTKESLRNHLTKLLTINEANKKYADVCKKIKQLYRKHNESGSHFKFQGV